MLVYLLVTISDGKLTVLVFPSNYDVMAVSLSESSLMISLKDCSRLCNSCAWSNTAVSSSLRAGTYECHEAARRSV